MNKVKKRVVLIKPIHKSIPAGVYEVQHENDKCYVIEGMFHNKERFVECSSLLLELF